MTVVATLLVLVLIPLMAYAGYRDGAFFSCYAFVRNLFGFLFAMSFSEPLAKLVAGLTSDRHPLPDYYRLICFFALFALVFFVSRWLKVRYTRANVACNVLVDRLVGPVLGLGNGVIVSGLLLIVWSMLPFVKYIPSDYGRMNVDALVVDTGSAMLRLYEFASRRTGGARVFLLDDEPLAKDEDSDGVYDPDADQYSDVNNNGKWDRGWLWRYKTHADISVQSISEIERASRSRGGLSGP